ncbi:MAG TPA: ABC transporter substrate-binding protein [Acidimicrobiales bacterium]
MVGRPPAVRVLAALAVATFYAGLAAVSGNHVFDQGTVRADGGPLTGDGFPLEAGDDPGSAGQSPSSGDPASGPASEAGEVGELGAPTSSTPTGGGPGSRGGPGTTAPGPGDEPGGGDATTITIGVHDDNPGAAFSQFGVQGGPSGDQGVWIREIVKWINANGGMGGREVRLVHHVTESLNGSFDQQAERACTLFTEDNDAAVVVGGARVPTLNLVECLARHDTPLVWSYGFMADASTFARHADYLYMPAMVQAERLAVWIDAVAEAKFFDDSVIGLVRYDTPIHDRLANDVVRPRLAAYGHEVRSENEFAFQEAQAASSAADMSAQASNAVLRFRTNGVDRVILQPTSAVAPLLFFAAAESQGFRPRYTYTSYDNPAFQDANAGDRTNQLRGSMVFGWIPAGDVDAENFPPMNAAAERCVEITSGATPPGNGAIRRYCDGLMFLKFLFDGGAEPTTAGIRRAVDALGSSYPSAWTLRAVLGPGRHDGAAVGRIVEFDDGCRCYKYTGPERPIP